MSTSYYALCYPVTSVRIETGLSHDRVSVWEGGALAGTLTFTEGAGAEFVMLLTEKEPSFHLWAGPEGRAIIDDLTGGARERACYVSERGEVVTASQIRAMGEVAPAQLECPVCLGLYVPEEEGQAECDPSGCPERDGFSAETEP